MPTADHTQSRTFPWQGLTVATALVLAFGQGYLFLPAVWLSRSSDLGLFHVDGVSLVFGLVWAIAVALEAVRSGRVGAAGLLVLIGLLVMAYSQELWVLYLGWEITTMALWLPSSGRSLDRRFAVPLHIAGMPLLLVALLGLAPQFAPPAGGLAKDWHVAVALTMTAVVLMRAWLGGILASRNLSYAALYAVSAPLLLVKALVAAPWDPFGIWLVTLLGTGMLVAGAITALVRMNSNVSWIMVSVTVSALGLASGAPVDAAGAVWVMLIGALWSASEVTDNARMRYRGVMVLASLLPGLWLTAGGALNLRYGIVTVALLVAVVWVAVGQADPLAQGRSTWATWAGIGVVLVLAAYPQALVEMLVRPAVQAMAGGVPALSPLSTDWGVGLLVRGGQSTLSAAMPATGILLAIFLVMVALYWLQSLARHFTRRDEEADVA